MKKKTFLKIWKWISGESDGFTFVETLSVLAISAVITAGSVISANRLISMAKRTSAQSQISQFNSALQCYFLDCGRFPTTEQGLAALWKKPDLYPVPEQWKGPYVDKEPGKDPWGNVFNYLCASSGSMPYEVPENLPFALISYGADGMEGGDGEDSDIVSWK